MLTGGFSANSDTQEASDDQSGQSLFSCTKETNHTASQSGSRPVGEAVLPTPPLHPHLQELSDNLGLMITRFNLNIQQHSTVI